MQEQFVFAGFGGQGVMFVGQLLAYAAMHGHFEVTWIPSYGPEMRGGTANCTIVISDTAIGSPVVRRPKVAIVFNLPSFDKYEPLVAHAGLLVRNVSLVAKSSTRTDILDLPVPATQIAEGLGNTRLTNVVLLGALLTARPVLPLDSVRHALEEHIPPHRRAMLDVNFKALEAGAEHAQNIMREKGIAMAAG